MSSSDSSSPAGELTIVECGPVYDWAGRMGYNSPTPAGRLRKILGLLLLTWVPIVVLATFTGHALPGKVEVPLFHDVEANGRYLAAVPLLEFASAIVAATLRVQASSFLKMGLIADRDRAEFQRFVAAANRRRGSALVELLLFVVALSFTVIWRLWLNNGAGDSSWERSGSTISLAGWWHGLVSMPILVFLLFRWLWVIIVWGVFLKQVSKLDLEVTATHPDRVGGLGFLAWGIAGFAPLMTAWSAMVAAGMADAMYHRGVKLEDLKFDVGLAVAAQLFVLYLPFVPFFPRLARCRFVGLLTFGKLTLEHDRAFDKKWIEEGDKHKDELLGNSDMQTLADAGTAYEHINEMWFFPFDMKAFAVLTIAALLPYAALLPLKETLLRLAELLI